MGVRYSNKHFLRGLGGEGLLDKREGLEVLELMPK